MLVVYSWLPLQLRICLKIALYRSVDEIVAAGGKKSMARQRTKIY